MYNYWGHLPVYRGKTLTQFSENPEWKGEKVIPHHPNGVKLHGFFQSLKYFEHCQDEVRHWIRLNETPIEYVGLHWRRGDYLQYHDRFPTLTDKYLKESIEYFTSLGYNDFMVFSDDIQHCKAYLPSRFKDVNFKFSEGRNEYEDLSLLASCEHQIIANSSFSWLAAWYNTNKNKIVISPSKETWFGENNKLDTTDLIPNSWKQIHAR
jgi:hypothetical protein